MEVGEVASVNLTYDYTLSFKSSLYTPTEKLPENNVTYYLRKCKN